MEEITIHIYATDQGGYKYDIYTGSPEEVCEGLDSVDGGHCISTMANALGMASDQAGAIIAINKHESECERPTPCEHCGGKVMSVYEKHGGTTELVGEYCETSQCERP